MSSKKIKCVKFTDDLKYVRKIKLELKKYLPKDLIAIVLLGCTEPAEIAHRSAMSEIRIARVAMYAAANIRLPNIMSRVRQFQERVRLLTDDMRQKGDVMPIECLYSERYDAKICSVTSW